MEFMDLTLSLEWQKIDHSVIASFDGDDGGRKLLYFSVFMPT
jgi:hypothetical protein